MNHPEFPEIQPSSAEALDYASEQSPVAEAYKRWQLSGEKWNKQVKFLHGANHVSDFRWASSDLPAIQHSYAEDFALTAAAIAAASPIEEVAIRRLNLMIRDDDTERRDRIDTWFTKFHLDEPTDEYVTDLSMAFGDPEGITHTDNSLLIVLGTDTATEYYESRLTTQANQLLDIKRRTIARQDRIRTKRGLGSQALAFIKRMGNKYFESYGKSGDFTL